MPKTVAVTSASTYRPPASRLLAATAPCLNLEGLVGNTPVMWIPDVTGGSDRGFWAKLEGHNPGGIKDRPGLHLLRRARERGQLTAGAPVVESTSGTLGLGLALAGQVFGHPVTVVTDAGMEPLMRNLLASYGARVEIVEEPHPTGGWQRARTDRVAALLTQTPGAYWPDQYNNPDNVEAYEGLALELVAQLGRIDTLVCSVGTGGHSAGVARVVRDYFPQLRLVGVDTIGSTIFGQPARTRLMRGLGSSIFPRNVDYGAFDEVHWVAPHEAVWACRRLAAARYTSGGWSVGAAALVASWVARTAGAHERIAVVFPDGPHRYAETIYSDDYCREHDLLDRPPAAQPTQIGSSQDREVASWTRCTTVVDPAGDIDDRESAGVGR